jgi:ribosomal-protein-alanine N-acetyltransferase
MKTANLRFERFGCDDVAELTALESLCFTSPWDEERFLLGLQRKIFHVFGFRCHEGIVAYLSVYHVAAEMEILNLAVHPEYRRRGLGRDLLCKVLKIGIKMGMEQAHLEVRETNTSAHKLYESSGFAVVGRRKKYYPDTKEDALLMTICFPAGLGEKLGSDSFEGPTNSAI